MSFNITLYTTADDRHKLNKTLVVKGYIKDCDFRSEFNCIDTSILIDVTADNIVDVNNQRYTDFKKDLANGTLNEMSFSDGDVTRYYFVENRTIENNNLVIVPLHEDVLETFRSKIVLGEGIVRRNENACNLYIPDDKIGVYANPIIRRKKFSGSFNTQSPSKLVTVAGKTPTPNTSRSIPFAVSMSSRLSAKNGAEYVWIPNCSVAGSEINKASWESFVLNPIGQWVICPTNGIYLNSIEDDTSELTFNTISIAQIVDIKDGKMYFREISSLPATGSSISVYQFQVGATGSYPVNFVCYAWSQGGDIDWAIQNAGTDIAVNNVWQSVYYNRSYDSSKRITLSTAANSIEFTSHW